MIHFENRLCYQSIFLIACNCGVDFTFFFIKALQQGHAGIMTTFVKNRTADFPYYPCNALGTSACGVVLFSLA
jgi:hypothetical protein